MTPVDPLALAARITRILAEMGIRYVIGGSVASSLIGEPRSTLDLDIMIEVDEGTARALAARLKEDFYVDDDDAADAVRFRSSFNAIEYATSMKVDFFPAEPTSFARGQLDRRRAMTLPAHDATVYVYAPEDLAVRKLMWFRLGGGVSDRQWRDVVGILKIGTARLDFDLLRRSAEEAGVSELLDRALVDAGLR
jgi:hypothetical protein